MLRFDVVVSPNIDLGRLTVAEKDAIILALLGRIAALERQGVALSRPPKTPDNSSTSSAHGRKPNWPAPGKGRRQGGFPTAWQSPQQIYDRIELPAVRPDVTRVLLHGGVC